MARFIECQTHYSTRDLSECDPQWIDVQNYVRTYVKLPPSMRQILVEHGRSRVPNNQLSTQNHVKLENNLHDSELLEIFHSTPYKISNISSTILKSKSSSLVVISKRHASCPSPRIDVSFHSFPL